MYFLNQNITDNYDGIRRFLKIYCETGSTKTPDGNTGRGHRKPKRNNKFTSDSEDDGFDNDKMTKSKEVCCQTCKSRFMILEVAGS